MVVDNLTDAALAPQLASSYGRYWTSIGKVGASPPTDDCFAYDNTTLSI
jgi:hypothetical protein